MNRVKSGVFYAVKAAVYVAMAFCLFLRYNKMVLFNNVQKEGEPP